MQFRNAQWWKEQRCLRNPHARHRVAGVQLQHWTAKTEEFLASRQLDLSVARDKVKWKELQAEFLQYVLQD
eukprot:8755434-Karenia_brevis.AAC.1